MQQLNKILYFEYTLTKLLEWNREIKGTIENNDFSVLKSLKLLFFVSAAKAIESNTQSLTDTVFDSYFAMPYGHVETEIYNYIKERQGSLNFYLLDNSSTTLKSTFPSKIDFLNFARDNAISIDDNILNEIDQSVEIIRNSNKFLILMSPFELVDLSHAWFSWKSYYKMATSRGQKSEKIPSVIIKKEDKIYNLQTF